MSGLIQRSDFYHTIAYCSTLFPFLVGPHFESFPSPEDIAWMDWERGDFSLLTTFNIKHCEKLQFHRGKWCGFPYFAYRCPLITWVLWSHCWTCPCYLTFLAHITLVTLSASGNSYDKCLPRYTLGNWAIEQMKNSVWATGPARTLFHSYWGWQQVEECPALLWGMLPIG